jgi:medium-chain acyl-[acyl-carrier-protein] hydrolase
MFMFKEKIYQRDLVISSGMLTPKGQLKLHDLLEIIQEASIEGSAFVGAGVEAIRKKNLYWVVMSYRFVITRMPSLGEKITVETYPSENKVFIYPRQYKITDQKGKVLIRGTSLWALLDLTSHKPTGPESNGFLLKAIHEEGELPWPPRLAITDAQLVEKREVKPSDLDFNGHMNNIRYLEFALDTEKEVFEDAHDVSDFQINFTSETHLGAEMALYRKAAEKSFDYEGKVDDKTVFTLQVNVKS